MTTNGLATTTLGRTGLEVTRLGFGALELRKLAPDTSTTREDAHRLLRHDRRFPSTWRRSRSLVKSTRVMPRPVPTPPRRQAG